MEPKLNFDF